MQQTPKKADASHSGPAGGFGPFMQGRPRAPGEFGGTTAAHAGRRGRPARRSGGWWTGGGARFAGRKDGGAPVRAAELPIWARGGAARGTAWPLTSGESGSRRPPPPSFHPVARPVRLAPVSPTRSGSARFAPDVPPGRTSGGSFDREGPGGRWVVRTRREWMVGRKCVMCPAWPPALRSPRGTHGMRECDARPRLHLNLVRPARFAAQFQFVHHGRAAPALITD